MRKLQPVVKGLAAVLFVGLLVSWSGVIKFTNKAHQMSISGTSNLHDWSTNVEKIQLQAEMELVNGFVSSVGTVTLSANVSSIKSDKGSVMDSKTKEALKGDKHPVITYKLKQVAIQEQKNKISLLKTEGSLTIAGVTRQVKMDVFARQLPNGDIEVWGANDLKMSDYGMKAPTALMGSIKTGDQVKVTFSVVLKK